MAALTSLAPGPGPLKLYSSFRVLYSSWTHTENIEQQGSIQKGAEMLLLL